MIDETGIVNIRLKLDTFNRKILAISQINAGELVDQSQSVSLTVMFDVSEEVLRVGKLSYLLGLSLIHI